VDVLRLFAEQESSGFADLAGSEGQGAVRLSERLLNAIVAGQMRGSGAIREVQVSPLAGNRLALRLFLARPSFLPPIPVEVTIDRQPSLPGDPVLALTLSGMGGLLRFAGPAAGFLNVVPPGVRMEGDRVFVDIRAALARYGLTSVLDYLQDVRVTTEAGRLVVAFTARVRG
jgi:hypothetical protein